MNLLPAASNGFLLEPPGGNRDRRIDSGGGSSEIARQIDLYHR